MNRDVAAGAALLAAALWVRLFHLGAAPLWFDEAATATFIEAPWGYLWGTVAATETNPPGYYSLIKVWVAAFGTSDFALRLPSAIGSALCIPPLYAFAKQEAGRRAAVLACGLLAVSAMSVRFGQEARSFALLSLALMAALWFANQLARQMAGDPSRIPWRSHGAIGLVLCSAALPYLHYTGFVAAATAFVYLAVRLALQPGPHLPRVGAWFGCGAAAALLTAPLLYLMSLVLSGGQSAVDWIPRPSVRTAMEIFRHTLAFGFLPTSGPRADGLLPWLLNPRRAADALLILAGVGALILAVRRREAALLALLAGLSFALVALFAISQVRPILLPRTVIPYAPLVALITAWAISRIPNRGAYLAIAALVLALGTANTVQYFRSAETEPWRDAIRALADGHGPRDAVVMLGGGAAIPLLIERYWPGEDALPRYMRPAGYMPVQRVALALRPDVTLLEGSLCPALSAYRHLQVVHRIAGADTRDLETLYADLGAAGARLDRRQRFGQLEVSRWHAPDCRRS